MFVRSKKNNLGELWKEENFDIWLKCFKSADEVDLYRARQDSNKYLNFKKNDKCLRDPLHLTGKYCMFKKCYQNVERLWL